MGRESIDRNTEHITSGTIGYEDLQVRQRLRTLIELAISIGRRQGMFNSLPPHEEDKPNTDPGDETGR